MDNQKNIITDSMIVDEVDHHIPYDLDVTNMLSSLTLSPARKTDSNIVQAIPKIHPAVVEFDPYEAIESFSLLCEPRLWYKCKAVRVEFVWMDGQENKLWLFLLDKFRQKIAAMVPHQLIPFYVGRNLEGGVFSLNYFQIDYHDPYDYPRLDNYSFVRNDWAILINKKTELVPTTGGENDWFANYPRVPSIRFLVEERTSRQMLIDVVGKLKEVSLQTYLHVINAGRRGSCELFLQDCMGQEIKLILHHIPGALPSMIAKASYQNVSIYAARVRLARTETGNILESTNVTKIEFNPIMPEAQELKRLQNLY